MAITSFTELKVWQKAHQVTMEVYKITLKFPAEERYGLSAQMRGAAVSMGSNIAEGFGRRRPQDKARFCNMSEGSTQELKYQLILARDLKYTAESDRLIANLEEVLKMIRRLADTTLGAD